MPIAIEYLHHFITYDGPQYLIRIFVFFYVGTAKIIRGEKGNENLNVAEIQRYFHRYDNYSMPGEKSFLYGKSGSYQV